MSLSTDEEARSTDQPPLVEVAVPPRESRIALVLLGLIVGGVVVAYAYITTR